MQEQQHPAPAPEAKPADDGHRAGTADFPSQRPWDWIGGYALCALVIFLMFAYSQSSHIN